ncbi:MAG: sodium:alanine symporter family protein [Acidobacteriota bacterium]|nr:sodium:alanine symporter family protein [Acidobacteriota bacterium]
MLQSLSTWIADTVSTVLDPINSFLNTYILNWPPQAPLFAIVLLGTGLFVTLRFGFIQVRGFKHAIDIAQGRYDDPNDEGDLKHYQALTTALSATVGIGNIAGVAIAIRLGGPGALFWMWVTAFFGMALKYAECTLALAYRKVNADGSVSGGPMYYMEMGLGSWAKWMAGAFAMFTVICSFATGNMNQANTMAVQVESQFGIPPVVTAAVFASIVGMVIIGGIQRIGRVTAILAPFMALLYVGAALIILMIHIRQVPTAFALIFQQAFAPEPLVGGAAGSFLITLMWGIRRGLFSNEAGQGSAPIAHAAAKTSEPVREGLVASLGPFIDTLVICSMTGLVILVSGVWKDKETQTLGLGAVEAVFAESPADSELQSLWEERGARSGATEVTVENGRAAGAGFVYLQAAIDDAKLVDAAGEPWSGTIEITADGAVSAADSGLRVTGKALLTSSPLTASGFRAGLPGDGGDLIVTFAVLLFAVSTAISWSYYGDRATEYLFGSGAVRGYRWAYIGFFFLGSLLPLQTVWDFGDVALGLMALPNLLALLLLAGTVAGMSREYFSREHKPNR